MVSQLYARNKVSVLGLVHEGIHFCFAESSGYASSDASIVNARIENVGKSQSCMVSKLD